MNERRNIMVDKFRTKKLSHEQKIAYQFGAILGDSIILSFSPDHEASDVLYKENGNLALFTELYKMRRLQ
jgi:hypothetical protein